MYQEDRKSVNRHGSYAGMADKDVEYVTKTRYRILFLFISRPCVWELSLNMH